MNQTELLSMLTQTTDPDLCRAYVSQHDLTLETLWQLKEEAAQYHYSEPAKALSIAQSAHLLSQSMSKPGPYLGKWILANAFLHSDQYVRAKQLFDEVREGYLSMGLVLEAARVGVGHMIVVALLGEYEKSLTMADEIEPILTRSSQENAEDLERLVSLLINLGIVYYWLGRYEDALAVYERQIPIAQQLGDDTMLAQIKHNQAYALMPLNMFGEAMVAFEEAEPLFLAENAMADLTRLYVNKGALLSTLGEYEKATVSFDRALHFFDKVEVMDQQRHMLTVYRIQAVLQNGQPVDPALLDELLASQAELDIQGPIGEATMAWILLGHVYLTYERWEEARQAFNQAHQRVAQGAGRSLGYQADHGLATLAQAQDQTEKAIEYYRSALQQIELIRQDVYVETFRANFLTDKLVVYQDLTLLYLSIHDFAQAFQTIEQAKSRLLTEKLAFRLNEEAVNLADADDLLVRSLATQLHGTLQRLDLLYKQIRHEKIQCDGQESSVPPAELAGLEQEVQTLTRRIQRQQPLFSPFATGETVDLHQFQPCLNDELFIQYHIAKDQVWALIIDQSGIQAHCSCGSLSLINRTRMVLQTAINRLLNLITQVGLNRMARYLPSLLIDTNKHLLQLYNALIEPLLAHLPAGRPLIISPDGALNYIPFHALYDGTHYLIERNICSYTPSATVLDHCTQPNVNKAECVDDLCLFGYNGGTLAEIEREVAELQRLFPNAYTAYQEEATTAQFLTKAPFYRFLHIAAHAQFRSDNPMLSAISLADRDLTLAEIAHLQLCAELVVLSGCETGYGQLQGTDLLSLSSGFLGAGANSLLVSLWRVEDVSTAFLMEQFYHALFSGQSKAKALQSAQLALLNKGREAQSDTARLYTHPAYWAPFTLIGGRNHISIDIQIE